MPKKKGNVDIVLGLVCVMAVTVASFFAYSTISKALDDWLLGVGITDPWVKLAIIMVAAILIVLVLGKRRLTETLQEILGKGK